MIRKEVKKLNSKKKYPSHFGKKDKCKQY